jgi:hypothetical protein
MRSLESFGKFYALIKILLIMSKQQKDRGSSGDDDYPDLSPFMEFARASYQEISKYTTSEIEEDRLIGFNAVLTLISLDFIFTGALIPNSQDLVSKIILLIIFGVVSVAACGIYLYLVVLIAGLAKKDIFALNLSIGILIFVACLTLTGLFLPKQIFILWGFILILIQIILIIIVGFLKIPVKTNIEQSKIQGSKVWNFFWNLCDKISAVGGVLGLILLLYSWIIPH